MTATVFSRPLFAGFALMIMASGAMAQDGAAGDADRGAEVSLTGIYNTGKTDPESPSPTTLNVEFHACAAADQGGNDEAGADDAGDRKEDDAPRICATIIEIVDPLPDQPQTMPNGASIVGFQLVRNLKDKGDGAYRRGRINAVDESIEEGEMKWYGVRVNKLEDGNLEVSGCVGFLCPKTFIWTRVALAQGEAGDSGGDQANTEANVESSASAKASAETQASPEQ